MKILCLFSTDLMPWVIARHWLKALAEQGADVFVGCPSGAYVAQLEDFGLPVREVYVSRSLNPADIARAVRSVRRLLLSEHWDILNCHGAAAGLVGRIAALSMVPRPVEIITNHGYFFDENMNPAMRRAAIAVERFLARRTDFTMFISAEDHKTALRTKIIRDACRAETILNGIDLTLFPGRPSSSCVNTARRGLEIPDDALVVGMVGRLIVEKGLREFFDAARILCAARANLYIVVVGDALSTDRGAWKDQFIARVAEAGLQSRFRFPGFVSNVYGCLSAFDILAHPTYKESFGRVIAEAMATGLPVVATNVRGCRELVVSGETGILVPHRNVDGLVRAISMLLDDSVIRRTMGDAGRARVVKYYNQDVVIRKFVGYIFQAWKSRKAAAITS